MTSYAALNGETRVFIIVGDPITQVKSPAAVTQAMNALGRNCIMVPMHVSPPDFDRFMAGVGLARNLDGIIATVPHKFAAYAHCATATDRARFLGSANILRRTCGGGWHGDMSDGQGFVEGIRGAGCKPEGRRALLVGAGGAGSAIALALLQAGVSELAIHDEGAVRLAALMERLSGVRGSAAVHVGSADPTGCTLVVNATPAGMLAGDHSPVRVDKLTPDMFVGDVITTPAITPLIEAAQRLGCPTLGGGGMFAAQLDLIRDFLLGREG